MSRIIGSTLLGLLVSLAATSQVTVAPGTPQVGSSNPVTAEPLVPRPHSRACTVSLFQNLEFADFSAKTFTFTPPADCRGPWAKVVFTADFTVTEGRQFDRTAAFYLGHANIYYGTTAEPSAAVSPSWHVERDVTDLSALFKTVQTGEADLGNFVGTSGGVVYNGIIYANAALEFYPASWDDPATPTPDVVVPLPDAEGGATALNNTSSQLTQSVTLPTNTERVYLDVIAQSQSNDEFWYSCVPNDVANELESCGNTGFRETEISIDGTPAGVAPVYPWIYTGGIDPYLWRPLVGVQTLDFKPYRVDLTPFAGLLADGQPHTVAISIYNADSYFLVTANLLAYLDSCARKVTGAVTANTLSAAPTPVVTEKLTTDASGDITGTVAVKSARSYAITGYVNTSHGRIQTTVSATLNFSNSQNFTITAANYIQDITQSTTVDAKTTVSDGWVSQSTETQISYPFVLNISQIGNADGSFNLTTNADQQDWLDVTQKLNNFDIYTAKVRDHVTSADTLEFNASGALTGHTGQTASGEYAEKNSLGYCYSRAITAAGGALTAVTDGTDCRGR
jgi:hypothetical protein